MRATQGVSPSSYLEVPGLATRPSSILASRPSRRNRPRGLNRSLVTHQRPPSEPVVTHADLCRRCPSRARLREPQFPRWLSVSVKREEPIFPRFLYNRLVIEGSTGNQKMTSGGASDPAMDHLRDLQPCVVCGKEFRMDAYPDSHTARSVRTNAAKLKSPCRTPFRATLNAATAALE